MFRIGVDTRRTIDGGGFCWDVKVAICLYLCFKLQISSSNESLCSLIFCPAI